MRFNVVPRLALLLALTLASVIAACSDDDSKTGTEPTGAEPSGSEITATGALFDDGSGLMLCSEMMESFPPQCGGGIPLDNRNDVDLGELTTAEGVSWTDQFVTISGVELDDGTIVIEAIERES